jgi:hypothetical protein
VQPVEERESIDDMFSVALTYWKPSHASPGFYGGKLSDDVTKQRLDLPDSPNHATGFIFTIPTGGANRLEFGVWDVSDKGSVRPPKALLLLGANVPAGELLDLHYRIRNYRFSWNYLTYPVPAFGAHFRVKTFWEVQYTSVKPDVVFPESKVSAAPLTPSYGIFYPGAGLGFEYVVSRAFRAEGKFSGMAFPGRSNYWDSEVNIAGRIHKVELFGGMKAFHFQTSPKKDVFLKGSIWGPQVGVRWVFR